MSSVRGITRLHQRNKTKKLSKKWMRFFSLIIVASGTTSVPVSVGCSLFVLLLLSRFSCVRLCETPWTVAHQAPPPPGFSRQEHWSGLPFPSPMHESEKWKGSRSVLATPWTATYQAPPSVGFSRQEYWSGVPLPSLTCALTTYKWITSEMKLKCKYNRQVQLFLSVSWHCVYLLGLLEGFNDRGYLSTV